MLRMQFILPLQKSLRGPTRADPRSRGNSAQEGLEALGRQLRPRHMVLGGFLQPLDFRKHLLKLLLIMTHPGRSLADLRGLQHLAAARLHPQLQLRTDP